MKTVFGLMKRVRFPIFPNKSCKKWMESNFKNTRGFKNYLLSNIYTDEIVEDEETGEEKEITTINWDIINDNNKLKGLQALYQTKHSETIANIYDQVYNDVKKNFCTFYKNGRGKPHYQSVSSRQTFRIPQGGNREINVTRKDNVHRLVNGTFSDCKNKTKYKSSLKYNKGWLRIPNGSEPMFIKCYARYTIQSSEVSSITFIKESDGKYYASIVLRNPTVQISENIIKDDCNLCESEVGVDINVSNKTRVVGYSPSFLDNDKSEFVIPARTPYKDYFSKLQKEQRKLSRKVKFSKNWNKQRIKLARIHKKIANIRLNYCRTTAAWLTSNFQRIIIEDLRVKQMKYKQPRWFQKLYNDATIYQLIQAIKWSCAKKYRELYYVSPEHTSKNCNECMHVNHDLKLGTKYWYCPNCGAYLMRDLNAAKNILAIYNNGVEGELESNMTYYDPFEERLPIQNNYTLKILSEVFQEEAVTIQTA